MIVAVPPDKPPAVPDNEPTVAMPVLLLLHVPLPSLNAVVNPAHSVVTPPMAGGSAFTVTVVEIEQPAPIE